MVNHQEIEEQLMQLDEKAQQKVLTFIHTLLEEQHTAPQPDLHGLRRLIGAGKSDIHDGADEHDHYIYGVPKKHAS